MPRFIVTSNEIHRVQRRVHADSIEGAMKCASAGQGEVEEDEFISHDAKSEVREVKLFRVEATIEKVYHRIVEAQNEDEAYNIANQEDEEWEEGEEIPDSWNVSPFITELDETEIEHYEESEEEEDEEEEEEDFESLYESCVCHLKELLWPDGDSEQEWDPDTLGQIANVLTEHGFGPEE